MECDHNQNHKKEEWLGKRKDQVGTISFLYYSTSFTLFQPGSSNLIVVMDKIYIYIYLLILIAPFQVPLDMVGSDTGKEGESAKQQKVGFLPVTLQLSEFAKYLTKS